MEEEIERVSNCSYCLPDTNGNHCYDCPLKCEEKEIRIINHKRGVLIGIKGRTCLNWLFKLLTGQLPT